MSNPRPAKQLQDLMAATIKRGCDANVEITTWLTNDNNVRLSVFSETPEDHEAAMALLRQMPNLQFTEEYADLSEPGYPMYTGYFIIN